MSGVVFETRPSGTEPVEGVWVAETNSHRSATTDEKGFYRIGGLSPGSISLSASKSSYYVSNTFAIGADVTKDIEIVADVE
jgi:Carboxypeptidase regulatory-like domain